MKEFKLLIFVGLLVTSCAPAVKPLYYWGNYASTSDKFVKRSTDKDLQQLIASYEDILKQSEKKSSRGIPAPGVCADFGFLLLQNGDNSRGMELLQKEIALYPESKVFIDRILATMTPTTK